MQKIVIFLIKAYFLCFTAVLQCISPNYQITTKQKQTYKSNGSSWDAKMTSKVCPRLANCHECRIFQRVVLEFAPLKNEWQIETVRWVRSTLHSTHRNGQIWFANHWTKGQNLELLFEVQCRDGNIRVFSHLVTSMI